MDDQTFLYRKKHARNMHVLPCEKSFSSLLVSNIYQVAALYAIPVTRYAQNLNRLFCV